MILSLIQGHVYMTLIHQIQNLMQTLLLKLMILKGISKIMMCIDIMKILMSAGAQKKLNAGGIEYVRKYAPDVQPFLMDERQLGQVFLNLLVNAGESIGPGQGRISIATDYFRAFPVKKGRSQTEWDESADDFVLIKIADTGRGICKEDQDKIFLPFFTTKETGSGLGLALAQKIIDSHDGQIDVDSRPEEGTLFRVKLPVRLQTQRAGT